MKLPKNLNPIYPPYGSFQVDTIGFGVIHNDVGLLLPVGSGKTYCAINICKWRIQNSNVNKILILCPNTIMEKWQDEILKFSGHKSIILHNTARKKREQLIEYYNYSNIIYGVINYEGLFPYYNILKKINLDMMVADESSRYIKNIVSTARDKKTKKRILVKRSHAALWLGDNVKYRMILTATLINKPTDIWTQFRFLDGGQTFGRNYWMWRNYFFRKVYYGAFAKWELRKDRIKVLNKRIYSKCITFKKRDILPDLPETVYKVIPISAEGIRNPYNKIKTQILAEIETEQGEAKVDINNILTKLLRLQQVTSGFIKDKTGTIRDLKYKPKINAVIEEIETILDSKESAVVWCRFRYTIQTISKILKKKKINHAIMHGDTKNKGKVWKGFQLSKTTNVFIGQIVAGGIGIELFKIDSDAKYQHALFVENVFGLDPRTQAEGRTDQRIGQNSICRVVDFLTIGTVDEKIYNSIMKDEEIAHSIMKDGVSNWL